MAERKVVKERICGKIGVPAAAYPRGGCGVTIVGTAADLSKHSSAHATK